MRLKIFYAALVILLLQACSEQAVKSSSTDADTSEPGLQTREERLSYAAAYDFRTQIQNNELPLDMDAFLAGLEDAFGGGEPRLSMEEMDAEVQTFVAELRYRKEREIQEFRMQRYGGEDSFKLTKQYQYLANNMKRGGVVTVQSGLQYQIIRIGTGARPQRGEWVKIHFRGSLTDGSEFDSSYANGQPSIFPVSKLIAGWSEAIQMMQVGGHWQLVIPPALAYGEYGNGGNVPPNAVLILDVELIGIVNPDDSA